MKPLMLVTLWRSRPVAPRAGAWIETPARPDGAYQAGSPPARGRGLKHVGKGVYGGGAVVAPRAGAWIETLDAIDAAMLTLGRPPRGGVD